MTWRYGSPALCGPFFPGGLMLGDANPDVVAQALLIWPPAVALTPRHPRHEWEAFRHAGIRTVVWQPPEQVGEAPAALVARTGAAAWVGQGESEGQFLAAVQASKGREVAVRKALACNYWGYGPVRNPKAAAAGKAAWMRWPRGWVAMPEAYTNVQDNLDAEYHAVKYKEAGAACVIPLLGVWSDDNDAPARYARIAGMFAAVWGFNGDSLVTDANLAVLRRLWGQT